MLICDLSIIHNSIYLSFSCLILQVNFFFRKPQVLFLISVVMLLVTNYFGILSRSGPVLCRGGRVVQWCWINFQCRGALLMWIIVEQGPVALAEGAGGGCLDIFSLDYQFSLLSPSARDGPI